MECQKETKTKIFASPHDYHRESREMEGDGRGGGEGMRQNKAESLKSLEMGAHAF